MRNRAVYFQSFIIYAVLMLGAVQVGLGTDIWSLTFESSGGYSTSIVEFTDNGTDYFKRTDGTDISSESFTSTQGSYYFAAQDIDGEGATLPVTLTIDDIDISGYTDLSFSVYIAEDDASDSNEDWDAADYMHIEYDIGNTGSFSNLIWVESTGSTNTAPTIDTDFDNTGDGTTITSTFTQFTKSITGTGSLIDIKITFNLNSGDEDIAIDNLLITGTASGGVSDPSGFSATTASSAQINLVWTLNGNSDNVMVAWNSSNTFGTPSGSYSVSDAISGGGTVIYNGSGTSHNHTSLDANTAYYYKAWSVDGSTNYSSGVTANATTFKIEPSNHVASFTAAKDGTYGYNRIDLTWNDNDGSQVADGFLIKASTADNITDPSDGTAVDDNTTIGSNSGAMNISHGSEAYEWTGLTSEQTYYFKIYPYTNSGAAIDYKTSATVPNGSATTDAAPEIPELMISEVADPSDNTNARFVELYNASGSSIDFSSTTFYLCRQANGGSWADVQLTGNLAVGDIYTIGYNTTEFNSAYGENPDLTNGLITGNGDDGYFIYYDGDNSSGTLVDAYGVINEDGSGKTWEYTDSHAVRKSGTTEPNTTWTASEWTISSATAADCGPTDTSLPVELTGFNAISNNGKVILTWTTASEIENLGFILNRKTGSEGISEIASYRTDPALAGQGSVTSETNYRYVDEDVIVGNTYTYLLTDVDYGGVTTSHQPLSVTVIAPGVTLAPCHPNPFNPVTNLHLMVGEPQRVTINIFDLQGRLVNTLVNRKLSVGEYDFNWTGTNSFGQSVASGIYFIQLNTSGYSQVQKVILTR